MSRTQDFQLFFGGFLVFGLTRIVKLRVCGFEQGCEHSISVRDGCKVWFVELNTSGPKNAKS